MHGQNNIKYVRLFVVWNLYLVYWKLYWKGIAAIDSDYKVCDSVVKVKGMRPGYLSIKNPFP